MRDLNGWVYVVIVEANNEDQLNKILPSAVVKHFAHATVQLNFSGLFISMIGHSIGWEKPSHFDIFGHNELVSMMQFCLQDACFCVVAG